MTTTKTERPVLITTSHRGVFFGYATETDGSTVHLRAGRCVIYWTQECKGFMGLAAIGPQSGSRLGLAADIDLRDVTSVVECTPKAAEAFESFQ